MKILFSLMVLFAVTKECSETKNVRSTENQDISAKSEQEDSKSITYIIQSRGLFEEIIVSEGTIKLSNRNNSINSIEKKIPEKDWQEIQKFIGELNLEKLPNLKAPTDKRLYDGAAIATLKLKKNGKELSTPAFDHGHPPEAIEALVNKILSLKETSSKD